MYKVYSEFLTSADNDVLSDTELETSPLTGVYLVRMASTVNTATVKIASTRFPDIIRGRAIKLRANGETRAEDAAYVIPVAAGDRVTIEIGGTTGTVGLDVQAMGV